MNNNKISQQEVVEKYFSLLNNYNEKPMYYLQINKTACRLLVRIDDIPLGYAFIQDGGESILYPINDTLLLSGKHTIKVEVFPMSNNSAITSDAWINIKTIYLPDKNDSLEQAITLSEEIELPSDLASKETNYYAISCNIEVKLPFDYSERINKAKDLRDIIDLEKMVVNRYNDIREFMLNGDETDYNLERLKSTYPNCDMNYMTKEELFESLIGGDEFNKHLIGREIAKIENYEMIICGNGKLVMLRRKDNMDSSLYIKFYENEEYKTKNLFITTSIFVLLYMPEWSNRLEMFV